MPSRWRDRWCVVPLSSLHAFRSLLPPPWSVEETAPCFIVRDANGQALAFVYCEDEPAEVRRASCSPATRRGGLR